jgi:hypothetical protein
MGMELQNALKNTEDHALLFSSWDGHSTLLCGPPEQLQSEHQAAFFMTHEYQRNHVQDKNGEIQSGIVIQIYYMILQPIRERRGASKGPNSSVEWRNVHMLVQVLQF